MARWVRLVWEKSRQGPSSLWFYTLILTVDTITTTQLCRCNRKASMNYYISKWMWLCSNEVLFMDEIYLSYDFHVSQNIFHLLIF